MSIGLKIKELREQMGLSKTEFANKIGIDNSQFGKIEAGKLTPTINQLMEISSIFRVQIDWLLKDDQLSPIASKTIGSVDGIPLVTNDAAAGFGSSSFSISSQDIQALYQVPDFNDIDFMIRVKGNSMYPKYSSGDVIACRILRNSKFIEWNKPHLVSTTEHGLIVKRLRKSKVADCITAISDNTEYEPFDIPMNEVTGIAIIVGIIRLE